MNPAPISLNSRVAKAVASYWSTRQRQSAKQGTSGLRDQGARSAVTGGAQMDGFIKLLTELIEESGIRSQHIFHTSAAELPCFFRPAKQWDLVVVVRGKLVAALLARTIGPKSTGEDLDRITDEVLAGSMEFWTAFRDGAFGMSGKPWLGLVLHIAEEPRSTKVLKLPVARFNAPSDFSSDSTSYRAGILCRKLLRERHYDSTLLISSSRAEAKTKSFQEPESELGIELFTRSLTAAVAAHAE